MNWFILLLTGFFCVFCSYCYGVAAPYPARHYSMAKPVVLWRDKRAAIIADIWNVKPDELDTATNIFGN